MSEWDLRLGVIVSHMTLTLDVILKISQVNSVCQPCNSIAKQLWLAVPSFASSRVTQCRNRFWPAVS